MQSLLIPELLILMNDISTCILLVRLKKFFFKLIFAVIFADTVEMLSLFHYKFELSHLPKSGGRALHPPCPHIQLLQFRVWFRVLLQRLFYLTLLQTGLEMLENNCNCTLVCGCYKIFFFFLS